MFYRTLTFRMENIVIAMIGKKVKGNLTKDLRKINLMEDDFNFNDKTLARATLKYAEKNNLLFLEQHGSRKEHREMQQEANKRLLCDLSQLKCRQMLSCSNDAKS